MGYIEFKFTQAVVTNPRARTMSLDWSYIFAETTTSRLQMLKFCVESKKAQEARIRH